MNSAASFEGETLNFLIQSGDESALLVQLVGTFTATLELHLTIDGETWVREPVTDLATGTPADQMTAAGVYSANPSGAKQGRIRAVDFTTGPIGVYVRSVLQG